jgi:NAD-specific glutamate dehydrogenase
MVELDEGVRVVARFLVKSGSSGLDGDRILRWRAGLDTLVGALQGYLSEGESARYQARRERLLGQGLRGEIADSIAALPLADRGLNIIQMCEGADVDPLQAAWIYAQLGDQTGINWIYGRLPQAGVDTVWDRVALVDIRWELLDLQRHITERVLEDGGDALPEAAERFVASHAAEIERVTQLQRSAATTTSATALSVIAARLRCLRADT